MIILKSAPAVLHSPAKKGQWMNKQMVNAMEAVSSGESGVNEAARVYYFER